MHLLHCASQISGHAAGERVPCPGWIVNVFERVRAAAEELVTFAEEQCAVLTFFYGNVRRSHFLNTATSLDEARFPRHFARFAVVEDEKINAPEQRIEIRPGSLDPKIHRVSNNEAWALHLLEHMRLQRGRNVRQQNEISLPIRLRQFRFKIFE